MLMLMVRTIIETTKSASGNPFSVLLLIGLAALALVARKESEAEKPNVRLIYDEIENHPPTVGELSFGVFCVLFIIAVCLGGVLFMAAGGW